jgi:hypothetical protein
MSSAVMINITMVFMRMINGLGMKQLFIFFNILKKFY